MHRQNITSTSTLLLLVCFVQYFLISFSLSTIVGCFLFLFFFLFAAPVFVLFLLLATCFTFHRLYGIVSKKSSTENSDCDQTHSQTANTCILYSQTHFNLLQ